MKKDADGFMDIDWCSEKNLDSWDDLRKTFQIANARKARLNKTRLGLCWSCTLNAIGQARVTLAARQYEHSKAACELRQEERGGGRDQRQRRTLAGHRAHTVQPPEYARPLHHDAGARETEQGRPFAQGPRPPLCVRARGQLLSS